MNLFAFALYKFCDVLSLLLLARAVLSWFVNPHRYTPHGFLQQINALLIRVTEPIVAPCRALLRNFNTGMFDFSIVVAMLAIQLIRNLIVKIF
ncbi:MAG: YggT family protein [Clostridiales Family XIII bacterium]|jgi:YggT family protein|nr:YggT family protein [Clostridiales Family XIII bacterium]